MNHTITVPPMPQSVIAVGPDTVKQVLGLVQEAISASAPKNPEEAEQARAVLVKIQKLKTSVDKERKAVQAPFDAVVDQIRSTAKEVISPLEQAQDLLKRGLTDFVTAEQRAALTRAAEIRLAMEAPVPEGRATPALPVLPPPVRQAAISTYQHRVITVVNADLVPREFIMVDMVALTAAIDAGRTGIPGVTITFETRVASR